jgi:hypothetical protein
VDAVGVVGSWMSGRQVLPKQMTEIDILDLVAGAATATAILYN